MICVIKNYPTSNPYILYNDNRIYLREFNAVPTMLKYVRDNFIKLNSPITVGQIPIRFEYKEKIIMFAFVAINN